MRKIDEAISRLHEVEGQLRALKEPYSLDPDWPEVLEEELLAEDVRKAREVFEKIRKGLLTEAVSRLNLAEHHLGSADSITEPGGNLRPLLREVQTEVRRARMRIEEFKGE